MIPMGNIIAQKLHEIVRDGELGLDYTFARERDKNRRFRLEYNVDDAKMKEILLKLTGEHFVKSEPSTNREHPNDMVHVFKISENLLPRFEENADYVCVSIYVKITWPDSREPMFIISFHEDEE